MSPRLIWTASFLGLCIATWLSWQYRFKDASGGVHLFMGPENRTAFPVVQAPDLIDWTAEGRSIRINASSRGDAPTLECRLEGLPHTKHLWYRIKASVEGLVPGDKAWQVARVVLFWRDKAGGLVSRQDSLCGLKRYRKTATFESVVHLQRDLGAPVIAIQNLALDGEFTIHSLEIIPAEQRWWFPYAAALLTIGWCGLAAAAIGRCLVPGAKRWRIALAAVAWVALAAFLLCPGPYYPWRPMLTGFQLGGGLQGRAGGATGSPAVKAPREVGTGIHGPTDVLLKPDLKNDPVSVLFRWKKQIRALMHVGAYAAMALGFSLLLGSRRGWAPVAVLGAGSELMQWLWGFGFDLTDACDLLLNFLGIAAGLFVVRTGIRWKRKKTPG